MLPASSCSSAIAPVVALAIVSVYTLKSHMYISLKRRMADHSDHARSYEVIVYSDTCRYSKVL